MPSYNELPIVINNNMEIVAMFSAQSGSTSAASYWAHSFSKNYNAVLVIFTMHDTDNNNDNWCAVYDTARTDANFATWKAQDDTKWSIIGTNNIAIPTDVVRTMAVYSGAEENTKTVEYAPGTSGTAFQALSYKIGVKSGDVAHIYANTYRRALVTVVGIN